MSGMRLLPFCWRRAKVASRSIMTTTTTTMEYHSRDVKLETTTKLRYSPAQSKVLLLETAQQRYYSKDDGYDSSNPSTNDDVVATKSGFFESCAGHELQRKLRYERKQPTKNR
mmetsp:Transcript_30933/g.35100  ORF Transcript_30933/g.35100 Transcript_30933/m.35100 type:complete len:113 (-) Transcript_30933:422-760(-)